jgi:selenocysteine lyase/cysteine desulfurase
VAQPANGDWTSAVLEAVERPGALPLSLASISSVHWSDGGLLDLPKIREALRRHGAALLVDATHSVGVIATDVKALDPDFLIFPTYKWVLGPYGRAFVYVAPRHQDGVPLEQTSFGRRDVRAESPVYFADTRYLPDARRYDMGERDHFISMEMASIGMEMVASWGTETIVSRLAALTRRISDGLAGLNAVGVPDGRFRAPHILCLGFAGDVLTSLIPTLASQQVYVAARLGRMRISPHVYNDEADADRFVAAVANAMA